jgi:hypothetical protein
LVKKTCDPFYCWVALGKINKQIKITIKSMAMVFLKWPTRRPLDIVTSGLVVIFIGDIGWSWMYSIQMDLNGNVIME